MAAGWGWEGGLRRKFQPFGGVLENEVVEERTLLLEKSPVVGSRQIGICTEILEHLVDADELVVLGDELGALFVVADDIFLIVGESLFGEEPVDHPLEAGVLLFDHQLFSFIVRTQPAEQVRVARGIAAHFGFQCVGEHAKGVIMQEKRDVVFIFGQVVVVGVVLQDVGVFNSINVVLKLKPINFILNLMHSLHNLAE
jgi:hypothetical protein